MPPYVIQSLYYVSVNKCLTPFPPSVSRFFPYTETSVSYSIMYTYRPLIKLAVITVKIYFVKFTRTHHTLYRYSTVSIRKGEFPRGVIK